MTALAVPAAVEPVAEPGRRERIRFVVILGSLIAIAPLTIDTYLPSLPAITTDLHTGAAAVQLTLTGTLLGLALGQVLIGPWSDAVGRRVPLITGLSVHVVASLLCMVAPNIAVLGVLRVLQGLGAAAATVVTTAVVRDRFAGLTAAKVFSRLLLVMGVAPILAPSLGGLLLAWTNWRGVFALLAVLGLALVAVAVTTLPESLPVGQRRRGGLRDIAGTYATLLRDRTFVGLVVVAGLGMAALFAYVAGSSFVYQTQFGLDARQFALVFGAGAGGLIGATQLNAWLLDRVAPQRLVVVGLAVGAVAASALVVSAATGVGGLVGVMVTMWCVLASAGVVLPNAPALALNRHGEAAGTAAALLGAVQFGVGAVAAPLVGVLGTGALAMGVVVTGSLLLALVVLFAVVRPARLGALTESTVDA